MSCLELISRYRYIHLLQVHTRQLDMHVRCSPPHPTHTLDALGLCLILIVCKTSPFTPPDQSKHLPSEISPHTCCRSVTITNTNIQPHTHKDQILPGQYACVIECVSLWQHM
jgi:hypothetical protein